MAQKIGVFDSGVGGLSVLREIWNALPDARTCYIADQKHVPYGSKSLERVRSFAEGITEFLIDAGCTLIVVACNTASAASLGYLRQQHPAIPFVGMEPALKPAAERTASGAVGVLATPATFQGALYASVVERFASNVEIRQHTCPGLVEQIEAGEFNTKKTRKILTEALIPMRAEGIDTIVLGCTHYAFVIPLIREIAGEEVRVIDPTPAVARQVKKVFGQYLLDKNEAYAQPATGIEQKPPEFWTTADPKALGNFLLQLTGQTAEVKYLKWVKGALVAEPSG